ncbi:MAG: hypothetical protein U0Y68_02475 [Blastocatellia bacterium]
MTIEQAGIGGSCATPTIAIRQTVTGALNEGDCTANQRNFSYHRRTLCAELCGGAAVRARSAQHEQLFHAWRGVARHEAGNVLYSASGASSSSRVRLPATGALALEGGTYYIAVTSTNSIFSSQPYSLTVEAPAECAYSVYPTFPSL